ncbi:MAG: hypothetical protein RIA09_16245 [Hoeflea sp.]|uniref:hypothetical protein n=1 Tax=Hoeflea sp. TaxID=1940281 RepID=UPI0032EF4665
MSEEADKLFRLIRDGGTMATDLYSLCTGKELGQGCSRLVFDFALDQTCVIKFETAGGSFDNVVEWDVWNAYRFDKRMSKWLAPCVSISPCGSILIQKKTTPIYKDRLPKKIPRVFTDLKETNWGLLDGRPVCHDYGNHRIFNGGDLYRLVNADWW